MGDNDESDAVTADMTINLSSRSAAALGYNHDTGICHCPPILASIFKWPHRFNPYDEILRFSQPASINPMIRSLLNSDSCS
ncbi:hypothetical protein TNCV_1126261 [Trichonephila clavipes]|nr:hypothetical protein TNCV_1126261 [Trichonephila clavipes]